MTQQLEDRLDLILDMRGQHRLQQEAEQAHVWTTADRVRAKPEQEQEKFSAEIRPLIRQAVDRANRHLAKRTEHYAFRDVSGSYAGPLYIGRTACHPIAYELCGAGRKLGKTLLIELTDAGMIEAFLVPHSPDLAVPRTRIDLGWNPVPLRMFSATTAADLVVWYLAAITTSFSLSREP